ncbi:MAG: type II secretion system protein, partial [Eubacteriales bacterium]|nr:type II secretion system protein [Eubacteriales bacterium]
MKKAIKNYLTQLQENEDKGFSLVELIIVMAIMAILVGVVASQVIPYMEKSRQSKDQQQISEVATALVSAEAESPVSISDFSVSDLANLTDNAGASGSNIGS